VTGRSPGTEVVAAVASLELEGIFPPLVTPFTEDGELDLAGLRRNLQGYGAAPLAGYVVLGTNGEFPHLSRAEKEAVIATAVEEAGGRPVLAQVGEGSLRETVALARRAAELGAAGVLAVTPHYYRAQMQEEVLVEFYRVLAEESPVPVLLYSIPQNTGVACPPALVAACAEHPNVVGIKDSTGNLGQIAECVERVGALRPDFAVLNGSSALVVAAFAVGARGAVLAAADALPFEVCELWSLCRQGRWAEALEREARLRPVLRRMSRLGVAGTKLAMDLLGWRGGAPRAPLRAPGAAEREALVQAMREAGLLRW
jgi:4-hydroxy-2-oxoglutarate aldolase